MRSRAQKQARIIRWVVLASSTVFFLFFSTMISEHVICPIGGFELFFISLFGTGFTLAGLLSGMTAVFIFMSIFSVVFKRAYCGYICPMGALQELSESFGRAVLPKEMRRARISRKIDKGLRIFKYLVLVSFIIGVAITGTHWMIPGDPFIVMTNLFARGGLVSSWSRVPFAVIFFFTILSCAFFFGRVFCKYICPAGAWYAILSKVSPAKIVREETRCIGCAACSKICPMQIDVAKERTVTRVDCIGCLECVNVCPVPGALAFKTGNASLPSVLLPIVAVAAFSGSVAFSVSVMPARGEYPQGGSKSGNPNGTRFHDGTKSNNPDARKNAKISFGGCSNCSGCGICRIVLPPDIAG